MKRPNILVVGSLIMDLISTTTRVPGRGETVSGLSFTTAPGGKGANQAMQARLLGASTKMVGKVGADDFGRALTGSLERAGVDTGHVMTDPVNSSGVGNITLEVFESGNENRILIIPAANLTITREEVSFLEELIPQFDLLMLQLEIPPEINEYAARLAHAAGVPVMMNCAPYAPMSDALLGCLTYISPNEHEARDMTGVEIACAPDARRAAEVIQGRGVKNVMITLGEKGAVLLTASGEFYHCPALEGVRVADPTAAGDSFVASFCVGVCAGLSYPDALEFASHTAAITVSRMGAQPSLPTLTEVLDLMARPGGPGKTHAALEALRKGE